MPKARTLVTQPRQEHSVPWFWPFAAGIELADDGLKLFADNLKFAAEAETIAVPPPPEWATANRILLDLDTMLLRDFSRSAAGIHQIPILIVAPYAGHGSMIADYSPGQSLVEVLLNCGLERVLVTDWKSATEAMKDFGIDTYLADLNVAVDSIGGSVHLIGLCQGGWMSTMFAARFPGKVASLVLAGSPIDTAAGNGAIKEMAHQLPLSFFEEMVAAGGGRMLGKFMLAGWKSMHPEEQYLVKYLDLYQHIEDKSYIKRTEHFERWYENPIDLPGRWYLQAIAELFKKNRLTNGTFVALGRTISLKDVKVPLYLLAGDSDDITTREQVFNTEELVGTPKSEIVKKVVPSGHIGLFMGSHTLQHAWPEIGAWIKHVQSQVEMTDAGFFANRYYPFENKAMLEIVREFPEAILAVRGRGRVSAEDYRDTLIPEARRRIQQHGSLRLLFYLGPGFEGMTPGAIWADTKFGLTHWSDFARMAVVTDVEWMADAVRLFAPMFHHPVRVFPNADFDAARAWIEQPAN